MTRRVLIFAVLISAVAWLSGCATPISGARKTAIRQAGVVSVIGPEFQGTFIGTTVFGNREYKVTAPEFAADRVVEEALAQGLKRTLPSVVVLSDRARKEFTQPVREEGFLKPEIFVNPRSPAAAAAARGVASREKVDTIAVMFPLRVKNDYMPMPERGVGVEGVNKFGIKQFSVHTLVTLAVYDGATGNLIAESRGFYRPNLKTGLEWKDAFSEYTAEERDRMRTIIHAQLREAVTFSLKDTGLAP